VTDYVPLMFSSDSCDFSVSIIWLRISMADTVDNILALHATNSRTFPRKLGLTEIGTDRLAFSLTRKRQCRLLDQYYKLPWVTGCSLRKS